MSAKIHRDELAGYDLSYNGDGGYTTGTIRVITEPIPATAVTDFLQREGCIVVAIELEKGHEHNQQLTALAPELRAGATVVRSSRYGGGSFSYYSPEMTAGKEAIHALIDISAPLRHLLSAGGMLESERTIGDSSGPMSDDALEATILFARRQKQN